MCKAGWPKWWRGRGMAGVHSFKAEGRQFSTYMGDAARPEAGFAEIAKLIGKLARPGYALIPLDLHYVNASATLSVGLAKGQKQYDKRETEKERDWDREKARLVRSKG